MPTSEQLKRLYTLATRLGLSHDEVIAELWDRYGIETTRELTDVQYEAYTRDLELRTEGRSTRPANCHPESVAKDLGNSEQPVPGAVPPSQICTKADCESLLLSLWPDLWSTRSQLARDLVDIMDWCRLNRLHGRISVRKLTLMIEGLRKHDLTIVAETIKVYLTGYTSTDERYVLGIARRLAHDAALQRARAEKQKVPLSPAGRGAGGEGRPGPAGEGRGGHAAHPTSRHTRPTHPAAAVPSPESAVAGPPASRAAHLRLLASRLPAASAFRRHIEERAAALEAGLPDPGSTGAATPLSDVLDTITPREDPPDAA